MLKPFKPALLVQRTLLQPCNCNFRLCERSRGLPVSHAAQHGGSPDAPVVSTFAPTRVRVQHDAYIRASRAAVWAIMQEVTPPSMWQQMAVVLATLESIYGVEYQGLAEQLMTAFQQANLASLTTSFKQAGADSSSSSSSQADTGLDQLQYDHLGAAVQAIKQPTVMQNGHSAGTAAAAAAVHSGARAQRAAADNNLSSSLSSTADVVPAQQQEQQMHVVHQQDIKQGEQQHTESSSPPLSAATSGTANGTANGVATRDEAHLPQQSNQSAASAAASREDPEAAAANAAAADADAAFMQLLLLLAQRAGFVPLSVRDVALGVSLNTDFLWQLFVKVSTERLDGQLMAPTGLLGGRDMLPGETQSLLVMRRGYSSEKQRGRWLLQKLDYLQLLLVKRALGATTSAGSALLQQLGRIFEGSQYDAAAAGISNTGDGGSQLQRQQQQLLQGAAGEGAAAAAKVRRTSTPAATQQKSNSNKASTKNSRSSRLQRKGISMRSNKPRTDAFGRPYPELESSVDSIVAFSDTADTTDSSRKNSDSSSSSSDGDGVEDGMSNKHQQQQQQQQQPKRRRQHRWQRQQDVLLQQLTARVQSSLTRIAHALSDFGLIPRMDVTPLEAFDEVYPLSEPPRFQPLFIEKATLPDILDPVLQPRLRWLGGGSSSNNNRRSTAQQLQSPHAPADGSSSVHCSSSSSADASLDATEAQNGSNSSSDQSSGSSSASLLQTLVQPVEIVEPTFRQMLVVYRRKPRRERWRELWAKVSGQQVQQGPARRSAIQLQVYRDIPLPSWQVVFPDKLLQFRPLDMLRLDLFGVAGATAALAQAKYSSVVLELLTLLSLSVGGTRLVLGYLRMGDRYKSIVAQLLAERTVASGEGGLEYLSTAAGLQQFKQAALAYVLLAAKGRAMGQQELAAAVEALLQQRLGLQVCFDAGAALGELRRFGLLVEEQGSMLQQQGAATNLQQQGFAATGREPTADVGLLGVSSRSNRAAADAGSTANDDQQMVIAAKGRAAVLAGPSEGVVSASVAAVTEGETGWGLQQQQEPVMYRVLDSRASQQVLQQYWAGLLRQRVRSILRDV